MSRKKIFALECAVRLRRCGSTSIVKGVGGCVGLTGERKREILSNDHLIVNSRDNDGEYIDTTTKTASTLKSCTRGGYIEIR